MLSLAARQRRPGRGREGTVGLWLSVKTDAPPGATIASSRAAPSSPLAALGRALDPAPATRLAAAAVAAVAVFAVSRLRGVRLRLAASSSVVATTTQIGDFVREVGGDAGRRRPGPRAEHRPPRLRAAARATSAARPTRSSSSPTATTSTPGSTRSSPTAAATRGRRPRRQRAGAAARRVERARGLAVRPPLVARPAQRRGGSERDRAPALRRPTRQAPRQLRAQRRGATSHELQAARRRDRALHRRGPGRRSASWSPITTPSATSPTATGSRWSAR